MLYSAKSQKRHDLRLLIRSGGRDVQKDHALSLDLSGRPPAGGVARGFRSAAHPGESFGGFLVSPRLYSRDRGWAEGRGSAIFIGSQSLFMRTGRAEDQEVEWPGSVQPGAADCLRA